MSDEPVVVTVAPTGPLTTREQHPRVPLAPAEIGVRVQKRFGFELDDRRRRIQMAIDQLESGKFAAPLEDEKIEDAQTTVRIAKLHAAAKPATTTARVTRRRWPLVLLLVPVLAVGAYAGRGVVFPVSEAPIPDAGHPTSGGRAEPTPDAGRPTPDAGRP